MNQKLKPGIKITDEYLEILDPEIAILFIDKVIKKDINDIAVVDFVGRYSYIVTWQNNEEQDEFDYDNDPIRVHKSEVKKIIEVKENEPCFWFRYLDNENGLPRYDLLILEMMKLDYFIFRPSSLTIGLNIGQLKYLKEWCE